jgi:hypothetical protein
MNTPARQTCSTATISLVFGILSWFALPIIGAIVAIVCGHMARSEIRSAPDRLEGDGLAVGGLVLGYLHLAILFLIIMTILMFFGGLAFFAALAHHAGHF